MYELDDRLKGYYKELDPKKRLELLNTLPEDETSNYIYSLYTNRYSDHDKKGRKNVDWWLWRCICLQQLCNKGGFFRRFRAREVTAITEELCMTDQHHKSLLYHEYRNVAGRYLSTCSSANYASRFMGFSRASDEEKALRACEDIWQMSRGIARSAGVEQVMLLWNEALHDELIAYAPETAGYYLELDARK